LRERGLSGLINPLAVGSLPTITGGYFLWGELNSKAPAMGWLIGSSIAFGLGLLVVLLGVPLTLRFREVLFDPESGAFTYRRRMFLLTRRTEGAADGRVHCASLHGAVQFVARIYFPDGGVTVGVCRGEEEVWARARELEELLGIEWIWGTPIVEGSEPTWSRVERDIHRGRTYRRVEQIPRDLDLYLRCTECGDVVPTLPGVDEACSCRNIVVQGMAETESGEMADWEIGRLSVSHLDRVELVRDARDVVGEGVEEIAVG
jgi:hypothetical protein